MLDVCNLRDVIKVLKLSLILFFVCWYNNVIMVWLIEKNFKYFVDMI